MKNQKLSIELQMFSEKEKSEMYKIMSQQNFDKFQ